MGVFAAVCEPADLHYDHFEFAVSSLILIGKLGLANLLSAPHSGGSILLPMVLANTKSGMAISDKRRKPSRATNLSLQLRKRTHPWPPSLSL